LKVLFDPSDPNAVLRRLGDDAEGNVEPDEPKAESTEFREALKVFVERIDEDPAR
jgi:hypothetical protein